MWHSGDGTGRDGMGGGGYCIVYSTWYVLFFCRSQQPLACMFCYSVGCRYRRKIVQCDEFLYGGGMGWGVGGEGLQREGLADFFFYFLGFVY